MRRNELKTPGATTSVAGAGSRLVARKRDTLAAELERDPQTSTAKRQQRSQAFTSHMTHAALERQLLAAQTARTDVETKLRDAEIKIEGLERDRRWLAEREKEEREEKEAERAERTEEKRASDEEMRTLRATVLTLREEHADLKDQYATLSRTSSQASSSQQAQLATLVRQLTALQDSAGESSALAETRLQQLTSLQDELDDLRASAISQKREDGEKQTWAVVREELRRQTDHVRKLEATNARMKAELDMLRERQTNVEVLREQKRGLERRLEAAEQERARVIVLEAELQAARETAATRVHDSTQTPVAITQALSSLRLAHAKLMEEHGANAALLKHREAQLAEAEKREMDVLEVVEQMEPELRALKDKVARRETRAEMAEREVVFLQALLASFNAEEATEQAVDVDDVKQCRIQQLEQLLGDHKLANQRLQKQVDDMGTTTASMGNTQSRATLLQQLDAERTAKASAEQALTEARDLGASHERRVDALEQKLFELQGEIGAGRHVPPGVRILSLKDNPAQQWADLRQAAMDRLKSENEALIARLRALEEAGAHAVGTKEDDEAEKMVPRASWEVVVKEKKELEDIVKQKEKRLLRLQQVFTAKSAEFREAIGAILGLKLAFYPNGQVRVTSQYDLACTFVFQPTKNKGAPGEEGAGKMQLIAQGEDVPEDVGLWMRNWLEREECIPGFLATVTLDSYERWKMEQEREREEEEE